jgi:hypothetical protein
MFNKINFSNSWSGLLDQNRYKWKKYRAEYSINQMSKNETKTKNQLHKKNLRKNFNLKNESKNKIKIN